MRWVRVFLLWNYGHQSLGTASLTVISDRHIQSASTTKIKDKNWNNLIQRCVSRDLILLPSGTVDVNMQTLLLAELEIRSGGFIGTVSQEWTSNGEVKLLLNLSSIHALEDQTPLWKKNNNQEWWYLWFSKNLCKSSANLAGMLCSSCICLVYVAADTIYINIYYLNPMTGFSPFRDLGCAAVLCADSQPDDVGYRGYYEIYFSLYYHLLSFLSCSYPHFVPTFLFAFTPSFLSLSF